MEYREMHIPLNPKRRSGKKIIMTSITIHSTANPTSTAINERNWLLNATNTRTASWHIAIDEKMAVEAIPLNEQAWHAGNASGNNTSIGIEICESGNRQQVIKNTVDLVAKMLVERNWGVDKLKRHFDWSGKICPRIMSDNNWSDWNKFKSEVQAELNRLRGVNVVSQPSTPQNSNQPSTWAKESWDWAILNKLVDGTMPKGEITREQVIVVLHRFLKMVK